jgi:hypothetical protein
MGAFLGCCAIAAVLLYVGRRIARMLFALGVIIEEIGKRSVYDWPSQEEWERAFRK